MDQPFGYWVLFNPFGGFYVIMLDYHYFVAISLLPQAGAIVVELYTTQLYYSANSESMSETILPKLELFFDIDEK